MQADIRDLDHYGIISGLFKELGLCKVIDDLMPKSRACNVTHGQAVLAMVINGLGFTERRLYMFPDFFANLPTERLLGDGVLPEHLNEYALGETLDAIYDFGATELFKEIALKVMQLLPLGHEMLHVCFLHNKKGQKKDVRTKSWTLFETGGCPCTQESNE